MVNLTRIYTRTGDDGTTAPGDMSRTKKTDPRLVAYADVDELNSAIGVAIALGNLPDDIVAVLTRVQNDLFDVGADLCVPVTTAESAGSAAPTPPGAEPASADDGPEGESRSGKKADYVPLRVVESYVTALEHACDRFNEGLPKLRSFVLPGGTPGAALLHVARTVARRAERSAWTATEVHGAGVNAMTAKYLNRLSDLLFILARTANKDRGDVLWRPGAHA